jgi:Helicase associated domain
MPAERIAKLEEIGFEFVIEPEGLSWETTFNDLKDYKEKNGNCDIPSGYDESPQLLQWTNYQVCRVLASARLFAIGCSLILNCLCLSFHRESYIGKES